MTSTFTKTVAALRRLGRDERGNVALIFAMLAVPMLGMAGAAIDYSRASMVATQMQDAIDAAALTLSKQAASLNSTQLQASALSVFQANFNQPTAQNVAVAVTYSTTGGTSLTANVSATVPSTFLGVVGIKTIPVKATSTVKWGNARLRVALVLDNTGSMASSNKMSSLKTASVNLVNQLKALAVNNGDVYISVIPFAMSVNIGSSNYAQSYIDWSDWDDANTQCSGGGHSWGGGGGNNCTTANHNTWNGCVTDRGTTSAPSSGNYDRNVTVPVTSNTATLFPAYEDSYCPVQMMGLSYDWSTMTTLINNMQPTGATNQPIGLVWGWQSLVGGGPLTAPAMTSGYTYNQVIILLSDGLNTEDRWYGDGSNTSTQVDSRMLDSSGNGTCANIKAAGITIYTVQVSTDGTPVSTLLQKCASSTANFTFATSATQIGTAFTAIGTNLSNLYIAK